MAEHPCCTHFEGLDNEEFGDKDSEDRNQCEETQPAAVVQLAVGDTGGIVETFPEAIVQTYCR